MKLRNPFNSDQFAVKIDDPLTGEVLFAQKVFRSRDEAEQAAQRIRDDYKSRGNINALGVSIVRREGDGYVSV